MNSLTLDPFFENPRVMQVYGALLQRRFHLFKQTNETTWAESVQSPEAILHLRQKQFLAEGFRRV